MICFGTVCGVRFGDGLVREDDTLQRDQSLELTAPTRPAPCVTLVGMVTSRTKVLIERGKSKTFAIAIDWPGWARGAKNEQAALEALDAYARRYAEVVKRAKQSMPKGLTYSVVERVRGGGATDFGIPHEIADADTRRWTGRDAERQVAIMRAAWDLLAEIASRAPARLAKGPRGGGRDRDAVVGHVLGSEASYGRSFGVKREQPALGDTDAITAMHDEFVEVLRQPSSGDRTSGGKGWPARYAVRRITWHALDHAWEVQDKS